MVKFATRLPVHSTVYPDLSHLIVLLPFVFLTFACTPPQPDDAEMPDIGYDVEERLSELGIELGAPTPPTANYVRAVRVDDLVFLSGHGPDKPGGGQVIGKMGKDLTLEEGQNAARLVGISLLNSLKAEIEDLNSVKRIVSVMGMVNATPDYTQHSQVMNGFSDLMVAVFGENGRHTRSSVGMSSLPGNIPVEIAMVVEIED